MARVLRRDHHRRRPQRPGQRRLPRARRDEDPRPREAPRARRRRGHRGAVPGLPLLASSATSSRSSARRSSATWSCRSMASTSCRSTGRSPRSVRATGRRRAAATTCGGSTTTAGPSASSAAGPPCDAEAYEEYGQLMVEMARFIKPILAITPPDLTSLDPRPLLPLAGLARRFQQLPQRQQAVFVQLMTMSASDFLDQWFETDPLKATMAASGIIGTYQGVKSPGHGLRPAPSLHGRDRRRVPRLGDPEGRDRRRQQRDRQRGAGARGGDPDRGAGRAGPRPRRPGRRASCWNPARRSRPSRS